MVVFDLGGVLIQILRSPQQALAAAGMQSADSVIISDSHAYDELNVLYQSGRISLQAFLAEVSKLMTPSVPYGELLRAHDHVLVREYPGAEALVEALHANGVATCVLSNTCARHWERLGQFPAVEKAMRDGCFLSFELGHVKPELPIYQALEKELGLSKDEICFLDDSAQNIVTATSIGWKAVQIPHERGDSQPLEEAVRAFGFCL